MIKTPRTADIALPQIGWREWVHLPMLGDVHVKAKIDTGAKTSAIHAWRIREEREDEQLFVTFELHPMQRTSTPAVACRALVRDRRVVRNSGGHEEARYVILTPAHIGLHTINIEITLTCRDDMGFRMLLGRDAVKNEFLVNPARSFLHGKIATKSAATPT